MQISTIPVQPKEEKTCSLVEIQILTCKNNMMLPICFSSRRITYLQLPFSVKLIEFVNSVYISYFSRKKVAFMMFDSGFVCCSIQANYALTKHGSFRRSYSGRPWNQSAQ